MIHERLRPKPEDLVGKIALKALDTANSAQTRKSGSVTIHNADGTKTISGAVLGTDETGTARSSANWVGDTTAPGKPIGVAAASSSGIVVAFWSGSLDGGVPSDFDHVTIYAKKDNETIILGKLLKEGSISSTALTVGETYEVYATAEDGATNEDGVAAHNISGESDHVSVTVTEAADPAAVQSAYDLAQQANTTANAANNLATTLSTLVRESSDGIDVGKSADGSTYSTAVARVGSDGAFHVLSSVLTELASYGAKLVEIGKNSTTAVIKFCGDMLRLQYQSAGNLFEIAANYGKADTYQNIAMSFFNSQSNTYDDRGMGLNFTPAGVNGLAKSEMSAWILCDVFQVNTEKWRLGTYEIPQEYVAEGLHGLGTVHRSAGVISDYGSSVAHYTKLGTWILTSDADILKLRVMTGHGCTGNTFNNSEIDIFIKDAWQSSNSTTSAYGISYELHNASSSVLVPYVVATAYNSCEVWIKNSWGWEKGWYVAEYNGGVWLGDGSWHQTGTPSGTAQNTACTGAAVYSGTKTVNATNPDFQLFSDAEVNAIIGHSIDGKTDTITVCSGDDNAYRGIMTASIQPSGNIVIKCNPTPGGWIRVNYIIATS